METCVGKVHKIRIGRRELAKKGRIGVGRK